RDLDAAYAALNARLSRTTATLETVSRELDERNTALNFLEEASEALGSSLDYEQTLSRIVDLAVPRIADYCTVDLLEGAMFQRLATKHVDPDKLKLIDKLQEIVRGQGVRGVAHTLRTGQTHLTPEITDEMW